MSLPPGIPNEFDVRTLVFLKRRADRPEISDEDLDRLQYRHLEFHADLTARGIHVVNGPMTQQTDETLLGMSVYTVGPEEALAIASQDPSVQAGRLRVEVASWWTGPGRIAFPMYDGPVGERRTHDEMD